MPAIARLDTIITVTPGDLIQIVHGPGADGWELLDDPTPFTVRVEGVLRQEGQIIGVYGPTTSGPERYRGLMATLLRRLDHSDWTRDNRSAAQFKVARSVATFNGRHPFNHPEGTDVPFPHVSRYGSLDSREEGEPEINTAKGAH